MWAIRLFLSAAIGVDAPELQREQSEMRDQERELAHAQQREDAAQEHKGGK